MVLIEISGWFRFVYMAYEKKSHGSGSRDYMRNKPPRIQKK